MPAGPLRHRLSLPLAAQGLIAPQPPIRLRFGQGLPHCQIVDLPPALPFTPVPTTSHAARTGRPANPWAAAATWPVMLLFFLQPLGLGAMLVRIPDIQLAAGLNKAQLGISLAGLSLGTLLMLPVAGIFAARLGVRKTLLFGFPPFVATLPLVGLATSQTTLFLTCLVAGMALSFTELGMNMHAITVEQQQGKLIMNRAHGFWSSGLGVGGLVGTWLAKAELGVSGTTLLTGILVLLASLYLIRRLPAGAVAGPRTAGRPLRRPPAALLGICVFIFGFAMTEGTIIEWSTLYLQENIGKTEAVAGYGLTLFSCCVAGGRFAGDWCAERIGPVRLARLLGAIALLGLTLLVTGFNPPLLFAGLALCGLGLSIGFPLATTAAGSLPGLQSHNIAFLTFTAMLSFLLSPPLIGAVAERFSLQVAMAMLLPILAISVACSGFLQERRHPNRTPVTPPIPDSPPS